MADGTLTKASAECARAMDAVNAVVTNRRKEVVGIISLIYLCEIEQAIKELVSL